MTTCASGVRTRGLQIEIASVVTSATSASTDTLQTGPAAEFLCCTKIHQTREIFPGSRARLVRQQKEGFLAPTLKELAKEYDRYRTDTHIIPQNVFRGSGPGPSLWLSQ